MFLRLQNHPTEPRINGQPCQSLADHGEFERASGLESTEFAQQFNSIADLSAVRRINKGKSLDLTKTKSCHRQDHRGEIRSQDLRLSEIGTGVEILVAV